MGALSVWIPHSMHKQLAVLAEQEGISIIQLINSALTENMTALMTALMTADYLEL